MNLDLVPLGGVNGRVPTISFGDKVVRFNKYAVKMLNLKEGDKVLIMQDKGRPQDLYIRKHENGYEVRCRSKVMLTYSRLLAKQLGDVLNIKFGKFYIQQGENINGEMMYPIFTRRNLR